ncbi:RnfABCDGE type electron transport complex subunit G [Bacteroides sp.]|uniref:RnfABCDGE type electron transport complex subunit G n=1 Tax=Bacteroides sp. TaxID=29523 RepID=UPI002582B1ED|nr:RnfABCDGE type electron transport complex subunit G [Bacteroides sp.]
MKKLESSLKNMLLVLTLVTAVSVALLAYVNALTQKPIADAQANILQTAIGLVVPEFDNNPAAEVDEVEVGGQAIRIYAAMKDGKYVGSAVEAKAPGYGGDLQVLVGFDADGNIYGYSILSHSETPGLGSKVATWFQKGEKGDVVGKNPGTAELKVSKDGGEVDAITASTITSRAFLQAVKTAYAAYKGNTKEAEAISGATQQVESQDVEATEAEASSNNKE